MDSKQRYIDYFDKLEKENEKIKAYRTIGREHAMEALENNDSPFPVVFDDQISTKGIRTTANSKMLENYVPPFDATIVERIKQAGGVILGKTITKEFGVGGSENDFGTCAAVAHGENITGFSKDYKGSMYSGAREYGLFAYKPTYGTVSGYGIIPVASSVDRVGILSKTFDNIPKAMDIAAGKDERDGTTFNCDADFSKLEDVDLGKVKLAVINEIEGFEYAEEVFKKLNLPVDKAQPECLKYALPAYEIISSGEFATNMEKFDGISFGYRSKDYNNVEELYRNSRTEALGKDVQAKIMFGNFVLSEGKYELYYVQAMKARTMIKEEFDNLLENYEFLIAPINPYYVTASDLAGLPCISMPFGKEGFLITGRAFNDKRLLEFGKKIVSKLEGDK
ncbi:MAG: amidase family protein [Acutalibacteraceae bacterium]|jgi:aspartyl-tRNA(Asn)/glutamyl-tRNA(Gln) amidotransferase subunit A